MVKKDANNSGPIQRIEEAHEEEDEEVEENNAIEQKTIEDTAWLSELISELQDVISHRHMEEVILRRRNNRSLLKL